MNNNSACVCASLHDVNMIEPETMVQLYWQFTHKNQLRVLLVQCNGKHYAPGNMYG